MHKWSHQQRAKSQQLGSASQQSRSTIFRGVFVDQGLCSNDVTVAKAFLNSLDNSNQRSGAPVSLTLEQLLRSQRWIDTENEKQGESPSTTQSAQELHQATSEMLKTIHSELQNEVGHVLATTEATSMRVRALEAQMGSICDQLETIAQQLHRER